MAIKRLRLSGVIFRRLFTGSRMCLCLGIVLVVLAVLIFPMKMPLQAQLGDVDYFSIGWLCAP